MNAKEAKFAVKRSGKVNIFNVDKTKGYIGIDEVAVGPIAGELIGAAVVLPPDHTISRLPVDSKKLSAESIFELEAEIYEQALYAKICYIEAQKVDEAGSDKASRAVWKALANSARGLNKELLIVIDGKHPIRGIENQKAEIGADDKYDNVSAAAIIAKAHAIRKMKEYHDQYPQYGFTQHKGYATEEHIRAIEKHGLCPVHRKNMATAALEKGVQEVTTNLSSEEQAKLLGKCLGVIDTYGELLCGEWTTMFLRKLHSIYRINERELSAKEQFKIVEAHRDIQKRAKRHGIDFESIKPFHVEVNQPLEVDKEYSYEVVVEILKKTTLLVKKDPSVLSEWSHNFLKAQLEQVVKYRRQASEKQIKCILKVFTEAERNAKEKGIA